VLPQDDGIFNALLEGIRRDELEVDVEQRGLEERDQKPWLPDMLAAEGCKEGTERSDDGLTLLEHRGPGRRRYHDEEVEIRVGVQGIGAK
jgi:hypothetical protein